ncbi:AMP-binding protein [Rhizobacter sp. Root404]|uniref:AMP-binding protein n=1 Tax=Rhizobacter sp. Root404 TaxID=1736528 RepID=UPI0006FA7728|nr:AMP-binding protein [Rhizobacter sp. Root404]KQW37663.1 long-chain fatty acid--CoA ligase [Rhizobacter sp. Root404]
MNDPIEAPWGSRQAPWLTHYPPGVPAEVDVHEFPSLNAVLARSCERFGPLPAFSNMGVAMRYADLDRHSRAFAAYLQQVPTLSRGARVALMMPNLLQYPVALFGVLRAGMVVVNVNPQYTAPELEHLLQDSGAGAVIVLENFAHTVQQVLERNPSMNLAVISTEVGDMFPTIKEVLTNLTVRYVKHMVPPWHIPHAIGFNDALREGREVPINEVDASHRDLAFLQYTGGTTGTPKGVMLTHGNLVANLQQLSAWMSQHLVEGGETLVCPLPLYHVYALTCSLVFLKIGAHDVLVTNPRDLHAFIGDLKRQPFSVIIGVNTLYRALLDAPEFADVDTRSLKVANAGGMAVQRVVAQRWKAATGVPIVESYGLSETSPGALSNPLDIDEWTGNVGMPLPSTQAAILDDEDHELATGEVGEICLRGPQVMRGYWMRPEETRKAFTPTGWLRTGDMGSMDERGCFRITDRKKDMIVVSGFKVFPNQIEDVVALHPGVAEVAAVGVPDEACGEVVKLIVVPSGSGVTEQVLIEHCHLHLTGYKVPRIVEFRTEPLPKTNLGKILRRQLRGADGAPASGTVRP